MYPLLVSGIASVASNLLDTWSRACERKAAVELVKFQDVLDRVTAPARPAASSPAAESVHPVEARIAELRTRLLAAPEVRTLLAAADPSRPPTFHVEPDGTLVAQAPGARPQALLLSAESAALARELAQLHAPASAGGITRAWPTPL